MKFKIEWLEKKMTKVGEKFDCSLTNEGGEVTEGVTLWAKDWPEALVGSEVTGDLVVKQNGQYLNKTLYPVKTYKSFAQKPKADIGKMMDKKEASIDKFQDNKELSIKISSTMRMAVDLAIAQGKLGTGTIQEWRAWLWNEWDKTDKDFPPFN